MFFFRNDRAGSQFKLFKDYSRVAFASIQRLPTNRPYAILIHMKEGTEIVVKRTSDNQVMIFNVLIKEKDSQTEHRVSLNRTDYIRITNSHIEPEILVKKSFEYLLANEPKERILKVFDFTTINRYYPNFLKEIQKLIDAINT